jgi:hypothetical protein
MRIISRLRRAKPRELLLIAQALRAVCLSRWHLLRRDHDALRCIIDSAAPAVRGSAPHADLTEVAWSVAAAARLVPGATCLTQASAGQLLLARRGYASTVRLSLPRSGGPAGPIAPHAWLMAGDTIVLGGTSLDYANHRPLHDFPLPGQRSGA